MKLGKPRIRAAKACKRCSQRKIKCDATKNGFPCSRCRMDSFNDCALIVSRRGTYDRKAARQSRSGDDSDLAQCSLTKNKANNDQDLEAAAATPISIQESELNSYSPGSTLSEEYLPTRDAAASFVPALEPEPPSQSTGAVAAASIRSVSAMFEDFLSWRSGRNITQCGLILLGEPSPLTFALEDYPQDTSPPLHDASDHIRNSANLAVIQQDIHPSHLEAVDIAYLKDKGVFSMPPEPLLNSLVSAYLTRFHPLYSIVNKIELQKVHSERKIPWVLLHTVCFIGATFCDSAVIHQSALRSRLEVRRDYYQKAKLCFDFGYETSKVILTQCAIMLSFWGPQTHSYWNPCSWIGYGVTFAVSLGIHRSAASSNTSRIDKGLLRRLWWTLVVRDTYCSVLLGRPFRINLEQSDTEALTMEDFGHETVQEAFYQIHIARLSVFLRKIMHCRFGPGDRTITPEQVHSEIEEWHSELQQSLQCWPHKELPFTCSIALELLYNYYLLLLYIPKPKLMQQEVPHQHFSEPPAGGIVESCARAIASHAITLVTKTKVCDLPHELFPAFFVAGIVLYRQMRQQNDLVSQMARANLDNCRLVLNEVKDLWDPGKWAMEIFDFLCTNHAEEAILRVADTLQGSQEINSAHTGYTDNLNNHHLMSEKQQVDGDGGELNTDTCSGSTWNPIHGQFTGGMEDYLLMPNFLPSSSDEWTGFQL